VISFHRATYWSGMFFSKPEQIALKLRQKSCTVENVHIFVSAWRVCKGIEVKVNERTHLCQRL
jgi:hypothetical protein